MTSNYAVWARGHFNFLEEEIKEDIEKLSDIYINRKTKKAIIDEIIEYLKKYKKLI